MGKEKKNPCFGRVSGWLVRVSLICDLCRGQPPPPLYLAWRRRPAAPLPPSAATSLLLRSGLASRRRRPAAPLHSHQSPLPPFRATTPPLPLALLAPPPGPAATSAATSPRLRLSLSFSSSSEQPPAHQEIQPSSRPGLLDGQLWLPLVGWVRRRRP